MTIIEFLHARIAEDEAAARGRMRDAISGPGSRPYRAITHPSPTAVARWAWQNGSATRTLAECAAKRAMLADLVQCYGSGDMCSPQAPEDIDSVVLMARVYAEHPDFNPAWAS